MSDFESEHDTDSENEEQNVKSSQPEASESGEDHEETKLLDYYEEINSEGTGNDLLTDLKRKAGLEKKAKEEKKLEPWQQYLQESAGSGSYTYKDPSDGTVYEWDESKRAWFPKIDENFIAAYQATYGFTESGEPLPPEQILENAKPKELKVENKNAEADKLAGQKRKAEEPGWFQIEPEKNHNVYISGLPADITEEQFLDLMGKYGIIMQETDTDKLKAKLYRDAQGKVKGDARCCYLRSESVSLAVQLLDESDYKGNTIHVEQAVFEQKGNYDPSLKPKKKKKKKKKPKAGQEKLLDWVDRDKKRSKFDRIVILKHMFDVKEFKLDPKLILDLKEEIRNECEKFGMVKKVLIFDHNPEGVCSVLFREAEMSDECVTALNGRWFAKRKISAELYDGKTNYQITETEEEYKQRVREWEEFLAHGEDEEKMETVETVETVETKEST